MKKCLKCGYESYDLSVCPVCNSELFEVAGQGNAPYAQPEYPQHGMPAQTALKENRLKTKAIAASVISFFVFALIGYVVVGLILNNSGYNKGEIVNSCYINEWADIKYEITGDLKEGTSEEYATYEDDYTDCGFLASDNAAGRQLAIAFEETGFSEQAYIETLEKRLKESYSEADFELTVIKTGAFTVAGREYTTLGIKLNGYDVYQYFCVRKLDDRMICIVSTDSSEESVKSVLASIKPANQ